MLLKFYSGRYNLSFGQPYVIMSVWDDPQYFYNEIFIIFDGYDGNVISKAYRTKYPKFENKTIEDFIDTELQKVKDIIFYKILYVAYKKQLERRIYDTSIDLQESSDRILILMREKFKNLLRNIESETTNDLLAKRLQLYRSFVIERNDFDI